MANEIKKIDPLFIFDLFDSEISNIEFFKFPQFEAFQHSFRLLEGLESNIEFGLKSFDELLALQQKYEDTKKYLIYWIYTKCPKGGKEVWTDEFHIEKTIPAIMLARNFSLIHDSVVAAQKEWGTLFFDKKKKSIEFKYVDQEKGLLFAHELIDHGIWETKHFEDLKKGMENIDGGRGDRMGTNFTFTQKCLLPIKSKRLWDKEVK